MLRRVGLKCLCEGEWVRLERHHVQGINTCAHFTLYPSERFPDTVHNWWIPPSYSKIGCTRRISSVSLRDQFYEHYLQQLLCVIHKAR